MNREHENNERYIHLLHLQLETQNEGNKTATLALSPIMASNNILKAAATAALASNGGVVQECPHAPDAKYHRPNICVTKPVHPNVGHENRGMTYRALRDSGIGASLVPNTQTVTCPLGEVQSLENPSAVKGFDTTWIVENTSTKFVALAWIVDGIEYSPFHPDKKPMEDPKAILKPGDWTSVPTFESFVYHVREIDEDGNMGNVVLQHRAGMIPLGNPHDFSCGADNIDVEPYSGETEDDSKPQKEPGRGEDLRRSCNTIDIGFRNELECPLSVYWAKNLVDVPDQGFSCDEKYKFHMGTNYAPQDFMWDWVSTTKYEGSLIGHTFVARLASDPSIVIDKYTLEPTRIIDCPTTKKQQVCRTSSKNEDQAESVEEETEQACSNLNDTEDILIANGSGGGSMSRAAAGLSSISG